MRRLLITGAGGFLGWNLCRELVKTWEIVGTVRSEPVPLDYVRSIALDLTDPAVLRRTFRDVRPEAVIHAAAASRPDRCQQEPARTARINVEVPVLLAELCADSRIPLVFTSSDLVFDGRHPPYREEDPVSPLSVYGEQKAEAEAEILKRCPSAVVCRMALMFGEAGPTGASFLQPMVRALRRGEALKLFVDEVRTPLSGRDAAAGLALALESASGILHLGGPERISRYRFGRLLAQVLEIPEAKLVPTLRRDVKTPAPRPADVSLECSKARRLGFRPKSPFEALKDLRPSL